MAAALKHDSDTGVSVIGEDDDDEDRTFVATPTLLQWPSSLPALPVRRVATGVSFTLIIAGDNQLFSFGRNDRGQLGVGDVTSRASPQPVAAGTLKVKRIACGHTHAACIASGGRVYTWGHAAYGKLGYSEMDTPSSQCQTTPKLVERWPAMEEGAPKIKSVSLGEHFSAAASGISMHFIHHVNYISMVRV